MQSIFSNFILLILEWNVFTRYTLVWTHHRRKLSSVKDTCYDSAKDFYECVCVFVCVSECTVCPMYLSMSSYLSFSEELCSCQSVLLCHKVGRPLLRQPCHTSHRVPPFSSWGVLCCRLTVETLPAQALRRLPPIPAVAPTDGAVIHLHFNASWDDRRSSEAIWTCHMGKRRRF